MVLSNCWIDHVAVPNRCPVDLITFMMFSGLGHVDVPSRCAVDQIMLTCTQYAFDLIMLCTQQV